MSYIRWGEDGSNVYVIGRDFQDDGNHIKYQCVACNLRIDPALKLDNLPPGLQAQQYFDSKQAILNHLKLHLLCGATVPDKVFKLIEADHDGQD